MKTYLRPKVSKSQIIRGKKFEESPQIFLLQSIICILIPKVMKISFFFH